MSRAAHQLYRVCRGACRRHSGGVAYPNWTLNLGVQRGQRDVDRHGVSGGTRSRESLSPAGAHGQNTLTILREGKRAARRAKQLQRQEKQSAITHLVSENGPCLTRGSSERGDHLGGQDGHLSSTSLKREGERARSRTRWNVRRALHRVLRIEIDSRF